MACGIWNWWIIKDLHTPYEWMLQMIADEEQPLGANRDDIRAARNTIEIINAFGGFTGEQQEKIAESLRNYLAFNQPQEEPTLTPEQAAERKRRKGKPDGKRR